MKDINLNQAVQEVEILNITPNPIETIYKAYKQCYAKGKAKDIVIPTKEIKNGGASTRVVDYEKMENFIVPLMNDGHCYDSQTEVLTNTGFKKFTEISDKDLFASVDPTTGKFIGFEKALEFVNMPYKGDMYKFEHKNVDLMVTPHHKIYAKNYRNKDAKFRLVQANDPSIEGKPLVMMKGCKPKDTEFKPNYFYQLCGFFIGDGYSKSTNTLEFHLKKERKIEYLKTLCNELGYTLEEKPYNSFVIKQKNIGSKFREDFYNEEGKKTFPINWISDLSENNVKNLWIGLYNSDGSKHHNSEIYCTTSEELSERLQAIMCIHGLPCSVSKSNSIIKITKLGDRSKYPIFNDSRNIGTVEKVAYDGMIYCITVSKGLLVVRRNNKIVLSGNTSPLEHCCVTFAVSGVSRALTHQLVRHRTGKYNQQSQRYVDFTNFEFVLPNRFSKEQNSLAYAEFYKAMEEDAEHYDNLVRLGIAKEISQVLSNETKEILFNHVHGKKPSKEALDYMFILIDGYSANRYVEAYKELFPKVYRMIKKRVQEDARYVLSNACASNIIFTMDFNNFRKFYGLRNCVNAQWEIRQLAQKCGKLLEDYVPFILNGARNCGKTCNECGGK